jgi:hypothetical protein
VSRAEGVFFVDGGDEMTVEQVLDGSDVAFEVFDAGSVNKRLCGQVGWKRGQVSRSSGSPGVEMNYVTVRPDLGKIGLMDGRAGWPAQCRSLIHCTGRVGKCLCMAKDAN